MQKTLLVIVVASVALGAPACSRKPQPEAALASGLTAPAAAMFGMPVYPNAKPDAAPGLSRGVASLLTGDAFEQVIGWYASHLPPDFEASRIAYGGEPMTTFADDSDAQRRAVLVKSITDENGRRLTAITLMTSR
jgi:hypothetical protein